MRKRIALILTTMMLMSFFTACAAKQQPVSSPVTDSGSEAVLSAANEPITIKFWSLPYFADTVGEETSFEEQLIAAFAEVHPEITVEFTRVELGASGDAQFLAAGASNNMPDVLYDSADKLISYAREDKLTDLGSLFTDEAKKDMPANIITACGESGEYYMYPISTTPYMMAFNKQMLESAGILNLLPYERTKERSWTVDEYTALLKAMKEKLPVGTSAGVVYAKSSSGDAATRALLSNLYGASFMNGDNTQYAIGSSQGQQAFRWLNETVQGGLLTVDAQKSATDTVKDFIEGKTAHTILYTAGLANNYASQKKDNFTEIFMPYPSVSGTAPSLEYTLAGAAVFNNGDNKKAEAAKAFIDFMANDRQWSRITAVSTGGISPRFSKGELRYDPEYNYIESMKLYFGQYISTAEGFDVMQTYWFTALAAAAQKDAKTDDILAAFVKSADSTRTDAIKSREDAVKKAAEDAAKAAASSTAVSSKK